MDTPSECVRRLRKRVPLTEINAQIFETSPNKTEIGAGVGFQSNAVRILRRLGYSRENVKCVDFNGVRNSFDARFRRQHTSTVQAIIFDAKAGTAIHCPWLFPHPAEDRVRFPKPIQKAARW